MFVGWEGVGLCSYLLIGFYFHKKSAGDAGKKAFIVNRIGDAGFLLGMFLMFSVLGSVRFLDVNQALASGAFTAEIAGFGVLSADGAAAVRRRHRQVARRFPLYVWLPDAMEGPTPVSRADPRRDHGHRGRLHGGALERAVPPDARDHALIVAVVGAFTAISGRLHRAGAERHQARAGLLHRQPARLHVPGRRRGRLLGGDLPPVSRTPSSRRCCSWAPAP